jgi:hypothetical protein
VRELAQPEVFSSEDDDDDGDDGEGGGGWDDSVGSLDTAASPSETDNTHDESIEESTLPEGMESPLKPRPRKFTMPPVRRAPVCHVTMLATSLC